MIRCPHCKGALVQKSESGARMRVDGPLHVDARGQAHSRCYWCKSEVALPLRLVTPDETLKKTTPQYIIRTGKG